MITRLILLKFIFLISFLLFMFTSLNNAKAANVERLYKDCLSYKNNSFEPDNNDQFACFMFMKALKQSVEYSCFVQKEFKGKLKKMYADTNKISTNQFIMSFLNWAEDNPKNWKLTAAWTVQSWAGKDYPCR